MRLAGPLLLAMLIARSGVARERPPAPFLLEVKTGPYLPRVDSEPALAGKAPYATAFGSSAPLLTRLELDYAWHLPVGALGLGLDLGSWSVTGHGVYDCPAGTGCRHTGASPDATALNVVPASLLAVWRYDRIARTSWLPLVPFAKLGLTEAFWWATDGVGSVSRPAGLASGAGRTAGWSWDAGLMLLLDVFDRPDAALLAEETGIDGSYLFAEYGGMQLDGFGGGHALLLSDRGFRLGVAFSF